MPIGNEKIVKNWCMFKRHGVMKIITMTFSRIGITVSLQRRCAFLIALTLINYSHKTSVKICARVFQGNAFGSTINNIYIEVIKRLLNVRGWESNHVRSANTFVQWDHPIYVCNRKSVVRAWEVSGDERSAGPRTGSVSRTYIFRRESIKKLIQSEREK